MIGPPILNSSLLSPKIETSLEKFSTPTISRLGMDYYVLIPECRFPIDSFTVPITRTCTRRKNERCESANCKTNSDSEEEYKKELLCQQQKLFEIQSVLSLCSKKYDRMCPHSLHPEPITKQSDVYLNLVVNMNQPSLTSSNLW